MGKRQRVRKATVVEVDGQSKRALPFDRETITRDYRIAYQSRQASLIGRKEVLTGKAKFGIFGDGKEVPQVAMAHFFEKGDLRAGYYRDQTWMFALGIITIKQFFAQLYAHADVEKDPASAGRQMNAHFATRVLNPDGTWKDLTQLYYITADTSPTGSQMPRLVGLAYASRLYRELEELHPFTTFSRQGREIAWGTIGNASCAEGMFWEAVNAIGVLKAPAIISIWDDGYGISVPNEYQITKSNIGELLKGFQRRRGTREGYDVYVVRGWDYPTLVETYRKAAMTARTEHVPALIHVLELTQPQGHSTSGSHERYKSPERLQWEREHDCLLRMRQWMIDEKIATEEELQRWEEEDRKQVRQWQEEAWNEYITPIREEVQKTAVFIQQLAQERPDKQATLEQIRKELLSIREPYHKDSLVAIRKALTEVRDRETPARKALVEWKEQIEAWGAEAYDSHLYSQSPKAAIRVPEIKPIYDADSPKVNGFQVINACFDAALARDPRVIIFGEDVGKLGDVNQGCAGLQAKYGELRVTDTGIRECTIIGQAIGMAMRGLRPIAEIQYLDYLLYALEIMSDDLATVRWRTKSGQMAPVIVRTRGHRLEGIWHSGSEMAGILNLLHGMYVLVPRDMTRAAGFYNTMLQSDDPALIIEVLNGYRLKERLPKNIGEMTVPVGIPEVLRTGTDVTIVTYGACCRIVMAAAEELAKVGIDAEVIDIQSLIPFDRHHHIVESLKKTNRLVVVDEDVPGGATAYILQQILEEQQGYYWLDSPPKTIPGKEHRPAYGTDGNYWSKPEVEHVFYGVYELMHEVNPRKYPKFF